MVSLQIFEKFEKIFIEIGKYHNDIFAGQGGGWRLDRKQKKI